MVSLLYILIYLINFYNYLNIFQQAHYKYKRLKKYHKVYIKNNAFVILSIFFIQLENNKIFIYIGVFLLLINLILLINNLFKKIVKLRITKRIIRLSINQIILSILMFLIFHKINNLYLYILNILLPILLLINHLSLLPIEKYINNKYIKRAKSIISNNPNLITIMITGSFGKTTIKNILYEIIKKDYITVSTPKSYNTELGICKVINESVNNSTEILILEAGAAELGDLKKICEIVKPDICVISEIGNQHLETFKTIENIIKEKFSIVEYIKEDGYVILNNDNINIKDKELINIKTDHIKRITKEDTNIISHLPKLSFSYKNKIIRTSLLGVHNITNILLALEVIKVLKYKNIIIKDTDIINRIENIKPIKNRLEYKKRIINNININIYDYSYNSNYNGFKNAIELLKLSKNKKIIITPGLVELGIKSKEYNEEIGHLMARVFNDIYLVKSEATKYLEEGLKIENKEYYLCEKFIDAYNNIIKQEEETIDLLIENDVPDIYKER